ncbi:hypothetical protein F5Y15DRAFT_306282 [Xylariaceae sp. FL0016]|nr:hypothetical protein F5Y15DRAFT_306282 [Xylariaceae sp. FL0016]
MRPPMQMRAAARPHTAAISAAHFHTYPKAGPVAAKILPALVWTGAAFAVSTYVARQLGRESGQFDQIFSQQNTPEVEAARRRDLLVDTYGDPRNSLLNILGWSK